MSTSLEISDPFGDISEGDPFNDYNTVSKGRQRISNVALYKSTDEVVVGIKTTYSTPDEEIEISHGNVLGNPSEVTLTNDQYIIAAFVALLADNKIGSVFFNIANTQGDVEKVGLSVPAQQHTVERAFGNVIAFHGTTKNDVLASLGFQALQTR